MNYNLRIFNQTINPQDKIKLIITADEKMNLMPFATDFSSDQTYMGLLRFNFLFDSDLQSNLTFEIPSCEISKMTYAVSIIFKDKKSNYKVFQALMKTEDKI